MLVQGVFRHRYGFKFKKVWNWSDRGGQHFSNKSQIQKCLKYPIRLGGEGQAYLGHCPKFSCFFIMTPPLILNIFLVFLTLKYKYILLGTYFQSKKWMNSANQEEHHVTIVCDTLCTQGFMIWFWKFNLLVQCFCQTFLVLVSLNQIANREQICGKNIVPD